MTGGRSGTWIRYAVVWMLAAAGVYGLTAMEARRENALRSVRRTTYSAAPGGYKALYLWWKEMGIPVQRWEKSFCRLPPQDRVLLVAEPEIGPGPGELGCLEAWVAHGGTLVLVTRPPNVLLERFGLKPARRISSASPEKLPPVFQPGPYIRGVRRIDPEARWRLSSCLPETVFHARDAAGGIIAVIPKGKGRVIAFPDPSVFSNRRLRERDHSRLALNLLATHLTGGKGILLVDEYHHGYGRATSVFGHLARSRAMGPMVQLILAGMVLWGALGRRFGPPRPLAKRKARSSMQYIAAMARLYKKAGARDLALDAVIRRVASDAERLQVHTDRDLMKALEAARARRGREMSDRDLLKAVRRLYGALGRARGETVPGFPVRPPSPSHPS